MSNIQNFFDNATPAQINQLEQAAPQADATQPIAAQDSVADLPALSAETIEALQETAPEPVQAPQPIVQEEPKETPAQRNWREVREQKLRAEWERDEALRQLQAMQQQKTQPQQIEEDDDLGINPDDVIEGKHLAKIIKKVEQRTEKKVRQQQEMFMQTMTEARIKTEMPDVDSVVNVQNLQLLRSQYPELAASINANPDLYSKAKAAYTLMTKLGIAQGTAQAYDYAQDKQRIAQNMAKPKPVQSVAQRQSPLAQANAYDGPLTEDMKKSLWKDMQKSIGSL